MDGAVDGRLGSLWSDVKMLQNGSAAYLWGVLCMCWARGYMAGAQWSRAGLARMKPRAQVPEPSNVWNCMFYRQTL